MATTNKKMTITVLNSINELTKLKELSKTTTLPDRPDEKAVQDLAMRIKQAILDAA